MQDEAEAKAPQPPAAGDASNEREPLPAELNEALVESIRTGVAQHGDAFVPALLAAANEVSGLVAIDARRLAWLAIAPKGEEDLYQRVVELFTSMQGPDSVRKAVMVRLRESFG